MCSLRSGLLAATTAAVLALVPPALADEQLDLVLQRARAAIGRVKSLQADLELVDQGQRLAGSLQLKRPNLARMELKGAPFELLLVSDGNACYQFLAKTNEYYRGEPGADGRDIRYLIPSADLLAVFFHPERLGLPPPAPGVASWVYGGQQKVDGSEYEVIDWVHQPPVATLPGFTSRFYISPKDYLVHRVDTINKLPTGEVTATLTLKNPKLNPTLADTAFRWTPPAGAKQHVWPRPGEPIPPQ